MWLGRQWPTIPVLQIVDTPLSEPGVKGHLEFTPLVLTAKYSQS